MELNSENKIYGVFGDSKAGKSSFLNIVTGSSLPTGSNYGKSITDKVTPVYVSEFSKTDIIDKGSIILDTPGLSDSDRTNEEITEEIFISFLKNLRNSYIGLDGIIFITSSQGGVFNYLRYEEIFKKFSENYNTSNLLVVFTHSYFNIKYKEYKEINECRDICKKYGIDNSIFWDSQRPLTSEENYDQRNELKKKISSLKPLNFDNLATFQKEIDDLSDQLREANKKTLKKEKTIYVNQVRTRCRVEEVEDSCSFVFPVNFGFHLTAEKECVMRTITLTDPDAIRIVSWNIWTSSKNCGEPYHNLMITSDISANVRLCAKCHILIESKVTFHVDIRYLKRKSIIETYTEEEPIILYDVITEYESKESYKEEARTEVIKKYVDEIKNKKLFKKQNENSLENLNVSEIFPSSNNHLNNIDQENIKISLSQYSGYYVNNFEESEKFS